MDRAVEVVVVALLLLFDIPLYITHSLEFLRHPPTALSTPVWPSCDLDANFASAAHTHIAIGKCQKPSHRHLSSVGAGRCHHDGCSWLGLQTQQRLSSPVGYVYMYHHCQKEEACCRGSVLYDKERPQRSKIKYENPPSKDCSCGKKSFSSLWKQESSSFSSYELDSETHRHQIWLCQKLKRRRQLMRLGHSIYIEGKGDDRDIHSKI